MTVSEKQLEANRKNAQKGGVKTEAGKAIVRYNALKHGLLAKEVIVTVGDGAENPEEFNALLADLKTELKPEGTLEEILVEKVAVAYWRLRRACRYEVGLIRDGLDNAVEGFYSETCWNDQKMHKTDQEIKQEIQQAKEETKNWQKDKDHLIRLHKENTPLEKIYDWEGNWDWLYEKVSHLLPEMDEDERLGPKEIRELLNTHARWSDEQIWQAHIELCDERARYLKGQIDKLRQEPEKNRLKIQVITKLGSIPSKDELDRLLRYEGAIERQLYKAMNQLERLQRMHSGEKVPAPVAVDVDVNTGQSS